MVTADHGIAFDVGRARPPDGSRAPTPAQIGSIPLFVKAPRQRQGAVDDAYVETVDILPTIVDVLDVRPHARMDGSSAFGPEVQRRRRRVRILERDTLRPLRFGAAEWERGQGGGARAQAPPLRGGRGRAAAAVPPRPASATCSSGRSRSLPIEQPAGARVVGVAGVPHGERRVSSTRPRVGDRPPRRACPPAATWPSRSTGASPPSRKSFHLATDQRPLLAAMVPASSFRPGRNRVEVFEVRDAGARSTLRSLGAA